MVLTIKEFDERNNQAGAIDFIHDLEEQIDQKLLAYAKADSKTRIKIERQNRSRTCGLCDDESTVIITMREDDCGKKDDSAELYDTSPNKLGEEISKFSKDQQEFIRKTVVDDYKKQGWQATWDKWMIGIRTYVLVIKCNKLANKVELTIE